MAFFLLNLLVRLLSATYASIISTLTNLGVVIWDGALFGCNLVAPNRPADRVVPQGCPGANGVWPDYSAPKDGDNRCSCPALNALANHGILPRDGRGISFRDLNSVIHKSYNFAPSFCFFVPNFAAQMLGRNYWTDKFDLSDLDMHGGIEHDASLLREDTHFQPDQGKLNTRLAQELLDSGTGPNGDLTIADLSRISGQRRVQSKRTNGQYSLSFFQKMFGSSNSSTLLTIFGGRKKDLQTFLLEEKLPDDWQPRIRHPVGLTMAEFNTTALKVEFGIVEELPGGELSGSGGAAAKKQA